MHNLNIHRHEKYKLLICTPIHSMLTVNTVTGSWYKLLTVHPKVNSCIL